MTRGVPQYVKDILLTICDEYGYSDPTFNFVNGSEPGDGFNGRMIRAYIKGSDDSGASLRVICKAPPESQNSMTAHLFKNEAHFYNNVMPIFTEFQDEKRLPKACQFLSVPKCLAAVADDDKEEYALIFEDLCVQEFNMWDRLKPSPVENVKLALREIGKFHSISIAMKHQHPEEFKDCSTPRRIFETLLDTPNVLQTLDSSYERCILLLSSEAHKNIYRQIRANIRGRFVDCLEQEADDQFGVMSHGDLWTNNCLYQFVNDTDIAQDIRILDWQTLGYTSLAIDLVFNVFISTDKATRDSEYQNLVRFYYDTLSRSVELLGSNPDELFTLDNLQAELKRVGYFVLLVAPQYLDLLHQPKHGNEAVKRTYEQDINEIVGDVVQMGYTAGSFEHFEG